INESNKNTPKILKRRLEKGFCSISRLMKFNSKSPQSSGKAGGSNSGGGRHGKHQSMMDDDGWEDITYVKCPDMHPEIAESNKNTPKVWVGSPEISASSIEGLIYRDYFSPTQEQTRGSNSDYARHLRLQSTIEDDKEWEGPAKLSMRAGTLMKEQEDDHGRYSASPAFVPASPAFIPAGVDSFGHRSRPLRHQPSPASEISAPKRRLGKSIADIQTTEEESKAEGSYHGSSICQGGVRSVKESHYPQLAQELPEQPDGTMQPKSNSLIDDRINRSTVGFRRPRSVPGKMMLILFVLLALATAYFGFGLLDTTYGGAKNVEDHKPQMNLLSLRERLSPSQKIERYFSWVFEAAMHSEYMGRLENSSGAFVGKFVDFSRRFIGNLLNFSFQDLLVRARSAAHEIRGFCKFFSSNKTVAPMITGYRMKASIHYSVPIEDNQVSEQGTDQGFQENSSTQQIDSIQEPDNSTIDAENHGYQEVGDQMVAVDQENSTFSEENESKKHSSAPEQMETQQAQLNSEPVKQDSFNAPIAVLGLDHKSSGMIWKFVATVVILIVSIG
ncbi:hypothetical protein KI387_012299, partial [Taxus chinensis]